MSIDGARTLGHGRTDLDLLLEELVMFVRRYVVMSERQLVAVALWAAHTHALDAFETTPYMSITSATKRCGKSRLFDVAELVVARPWRVVTPSEAVLFRKIESACPTLLLDEADAIFAEKNGATEPLRGLLNAGNRRGTTVPRCVGPTFTLTDFSVFCPKAVAGIGRLPDTIADRSIPIRLTRKAPGEQADRFRRREADAIAEPLREALTEWAAAADTMLADARPLVPAELDDRAEEAWEPLLAIAELAGGDWPARARAAAVELSTGEGREEDEAGLRLLADIRSVFSAEKISTVSLIEKLCEDDEAGWGDWFGAPIKPRALGRLLGQFGIKSRNVRVDEGVVKGYHRSDFEDAWKRYPEVSDPVSATSATTASTSQKRRLSYPLHDHDVADTQQVANPHGFSDVADVAGGPPETVANGLFEFFPGDAATWEVACVVCDMRFMHGDDGSAAVTCPVCVARRPLPAALRLGEEGKS